MRKMSREIKFRAWDKIHNRMIYNNQEEIIKPEYLKDWPNKIFSPPIVTNQGVSFWVYETQLKDATDEHFDHMSGLAFDSLIISQYTGLKDKNGVEIYEGDIVGGYPHGTVIVRWCDEYACFEACWNDVECDENNVCFTIEKTSLFANELNNCKDAWVVLGNIYQNPELTQ